jgi:RND family efflux transporter MFP subunit
MLHKLFNKGKRLKEKFEISNKTIVIGIGVFLIFILFTLKSCSKHKEMEPEETLQAVLLEQVKRGNILEEQEITGRIANDTVKIGYDRIQGKVKQVYVLPGDTVSKGAPLYDMDITSSSVTINYQMKEIEVGMHELSVSLRQLKTEKGKLKKLYEAGVVSQSELNETVYQIEQLNAQRASLQAKRKTLQSSINQLESYAYVIAPKAGTVKKVTFGPGDMIGQSDYIEIQTNQKPICKIYVTEKTLSFLKKGMKLSVKLSGHETVVPGHVKKINPIGEEEFLFPVEIEIDTKDTAQEESYIDGKTVQVKIPVYSNPTAIVVPKKAVITFNDETYVYCIDKEGKVKKVMVESSITSHGMTEIKSGLTTNDKIIVKGQYEVSEGQKVSIIKN